MPGDWVQEGCHTPVCGQCHPQACAADASCTCGASGVVINKPGSCRVGCLREACRLAYMPAGSEKKLLLFQQWCLG
jgi:hypothetical protein